MATYNHENGMVIPGQTWSIPENYFPGSLGNAKNVRSTEADFRSSFNMTQSGAAVLLNRAVTKALFRTVQAHKYPEVFSGFGAGSNCSVGEYQMLDDFTIPDTEEKKAAIAAAPVALCIYIPNDGSFYAGVAADKAAKVFPPVTPKHSNDVTNDTAYLLYGMMGYLMGDSELMSMVEGMVDNYEAYIKDPTSSEGKEFTRMMFVANDNIYRRLSTKKAGSGAPEVYTAACGLSNIKEAQVISGRYAPSEIYGELRFFAGETSPKTTGGHAKKNINEMCGILAKNECQRMAAARATDLKVLLKGFKCVTAPMKRSLQDLGFEFRESTKHYKLVYYGDDRYIATLSKTPSDARSGMNLASSMIKTML